MLIYELNVSCFDTIVDVLVFRICMSSVSVCLSNLIQTQNIQIGSVLHGKLHIIRKPACIKTARNGPFDDFNKIIICL